MEIRQTQEFKCAYYSRLKYSHGNQRISCFQTDGEKQFGWEQVEFFPAWVIFSLAPLADIGTDPNATQCCFFFFGCSLFCCKPSQMAACRMTMQEDMRHDSIFQDCWFWLKMDYHSLFAQIKYRWVTWAAGNTFFPQKRKIISHLHHEHYSYKLGGQRKERIKSKLFNIDETLLLKFDNLTVRLGSGFTKHQECLHVIFGFR